MLRLNLNTFIALFIRIMDFLGIFIFLLFIAHGISASSFKRVLRTSLVDKNAALATYINLTGYADCARLCRSDCLSFYYEPDTKKCKTFPKKLCRNEGAKKLTSTMVFVKITEYNGTPNKPTDCSQMDALCHSGVYRITPSEGFSFDVYCDMDTPNGPWTVLQNRESGEVEFYRSWEDYKNGFGNLSGNYWLGNDAIHFLTATASVLRINLVSWLGHERYAEYSTFNVENKADDYRLTVSGFSGTVRYDAMANHNGMKFSTFDNDNDEWNYGNCAPYAKAGWWYNACYEANLNGGLYINGTSKGNSLIWKHFYKDSYPHMMKTRMLVKRPQQ